MLVCIPKELYPGSPPEELFDSAERFFIARMGRGVEGLREKLGRDWRGNGTSWVLALDGPTAVGFACGTGGGNGFRVSLLYLSGRHNSAENGILLLDRLVRGGSFALASGANMSPPQGELGPAMQKAGWVLLPRERRVLLFKESGLFRPPLLEEHNVRRLRREELPLLALLQAAAFHSSPDARLYPALADPFESEAMLSDCLDGAFGEPFPPGCLVARRRDGLVTGFIVSTIETGREPLGFVATLAVSPPQRGKGVGRLLLTHALCAYAAAGLAGGSLQVSTANRAAIALYDSLGYRVAETETAYRLDLDG